MFGIAEFERTKRNWIIELVIHSITWGPLLKTKGLVLCFWIAKVLTVRCKRHLLVRLRVTYKSSSGNRVSSAKLPYSLYCVLLGKDNGALERETTSSLL